MNDTLPPFPVDDDVLDAIEEAMKATYRVNAAGEHEVVGGHFTLTRLLDFYSGYDHRLAVPVDDHELGDFLQLRPATVEYPHQIYTRDDVIRSLINETRRLRSTAPPPAAPHWTDPPPPEGATAMTDQPTTPTGDRFDGTTVTAAADKLREIAAGVVPAAQTLADSLNSAADVLDNIGGTLNQN